MYVIEVKSGWFEQTSCFNVVNQEGLEMYLAWIDPASIYNIFLIPGTISA